MTLDQLIGRQLGDFIIRERIGHGGMATVYRAYQRSVRRDVALKIIPLGSPGRTMDSFRRRFEREVEFIAKLEHIHILPVHEYGITEDAAYLAMRLLRGGTLNDLLRNAPLDVDVAADLFLQFASGLGYAHSRGVIHRDLKPSNIMLDDSGNVLLTDFGLAKLVGESLELTKPGTVIGTPTYMSPEQALGKELDPRSDVYSSGVVLYHMLAGRPPFKSESGDVVATIFHQVTTPPPPLRQINPNISPEVEQVVLRALSKEPDQRYQSMGAMASALERALGRRGSSSGTTLEELAETQPIAVMRPWGAGAEDDSDPVGRGFGATPDSSTGRAVVRRRRRKVALWIAAVASLAAIATIATLQWSGRGVPWGERRPNATVRSGERAPAVEAAPTTSEVERARGALGSTGFIAYVTCTQRTEYHATQTREMRDWATERRLDFRVFDSDGDEYLQLTQIEKARADGARGLIVCPLNANLLATPLEAARDAGIPLVLMASSIPSYGGVLIAGDDFDMGLAAGRFAGEIVARERGGRARVLILDFPEVPSLVQRAEGLRQGLLEKAPRARVVGHAKGGTREFAAESVGQVLARGRSFDVILSINDAGAFGAIAAMERAGVEPGSVVISSVDAEALAREHIRRGYFMRGSVAIDRSQFSEASMGAMVKLLAGATLPETFTVAPGEVVTRETLAVTP